MSRLLIGTSLLQGLDPGAQMLSCQCPDINLESQRLNFTLEDPVGSRPA
jgi:hypothetical protein